MICCFVPFSPSQQRAADARTFEALSNQVASTLGGFKTLHQKILSIKDDSEAKREGHLEARERLVSEVESRSVETRT